MFYYKNLYEQEAEYKKILKATLNEAEILIKKYQIQLQRSLGNLDILNDEINKLKNDIKAVKSRNSGYRIETDYAHKVADAVSKDTTSKGILICGSGIGMSLAANKHNNIRAALCHDHYTAKMARLHNDANILCFGERIVGRGVAESILDAWIASGFDGGRHCTRVEKIEIQ